MTQPGQFEPKEPYTEPEAITVDATAELVNRASASEPTNRNRGRVARDYSKLRPVIAVLRQKSYSQRAMMAWLRDNGINVPHGSVMKLRKQVDEELAAAMKLRKQAAAAG